jgi:hypothetical protein
MLFLTEKTRIELGIPADCGIFIKKQGEWMIEEDDFRRCDPGKAELLLGPSSWTDHEGNGGW